jgi:putative copper export protein
MTVPEIVSVVSRWLHIMAAATALGGTIFALFVAFPAASEIAPEAREAFHVAARKRWSKIVAAAIATLLITGLYNFFVIKTNYKLIMPRWYDPVFGVKFLLALVVFAVASLLAGRTSLAQRMRSNVRFWLAVNLLLAALIVAVSGVLRTTHPPIGPAPKVEVADFAQPDR